ncbi:MAG: DNA translocase FtsK 4TM domain-containing protein [Candidatus Promineifilaceae bacterium]
MTRKKSSSTRSSSRKPSSSRSSRRSSSSKGSRFNFSLNSQQKALIAGIILIFFTVVILLSLLSPNQGKLTETLSGWMWQIFGWGGAIVPVIIGAFGFYLVLWGMEQPPDLPNLRLLGLLLLLVSVEAFATLAVLTWNSELPDVTSIAKAGEGGGYLGGFVVWGLSQGVGRLGAVFVLLIVGIIATVLVSGVSREDAGIFLRQAFARSPKTEEREIPINTARSSARATASKSTASKSTASKSTASKSTTNSPRQPELLPTDTASQTASQTTASARPKRQAANTQRSGTTAQPTPAGQGLEPSTESMTGLYGQEGGGSWELPALATLLEAGSEKDISDVQIREQVEIIEHTLDSFGAPATVVEINQGPTITQFGVEPSFIEQRSGKRTKVKVGKIASLADDLALALAARSIRIQAPVPGKGYVGIEVPNSEKSVVSLRDVMESAEFQKLKAPLAIGLGQNVAGQPIIADLAQMPHLLIAGTTGSGKSVCVNSIVACLLLQNTPDQLKFVMVDPKRVELTGYNAIPHLVAPVVVDLDRVVGTLKWAMREMDNRYKRLADMSVRNIVEYNKKVAANGKDGTEKMPYIVFVIDELADLMMLSPEETEKGVTRLAQLARATGIHMIIATQRPSVDVVTGLIKANFPARVAFAVASGTDSRVILDTTGAERLLGQGDMLFQSPDAAAPLRMQGCFVGPHELQNIIDYWRGAKRFVRVRTEAEQEVAGEAEETPESPPEPETAQPLLWDEMREEEEEAARYSDELLPEAIALVRQLNKASTSLLQRRFRIGYTRAARMIDVMEEDGIIGPPTGTSKAREVRPWSGQAEGGG